MISSERLSKVFVEVADTLVDDFDLVEFLHNLAQRAVEVCDALAAGILLADEHNNLQCLAASSDETKLIELFQVQSLDGPCLDCFRRGRPVMHPDLSTAGDQWPLFGPRARQAGFESVHAFPMRLRNQVIGTLSIFGDATGRFEQADVQIVQSLSDIATIAILQVRNLERAETLTEQLQGALNSRIKLEQAKGALSRQLNVSADQAFELMRAHARKSRTRLGDVAHAVLTEPGSVPDLTAPAHRA